MRFLLIDASVVLDENQQPVEPRRPSPSNGSVIGEIDRYLLNTGTADNPDPDCMEADAPDSTLEDEAEAEVEAEAEAGYGVAAAAAGAAAAGYYADAQTATATATEKVEFKYETIFDNRV